MKRRSLIVHILVLVVAGVVIPALLLSLVQRRISSKALWDAIGLQQTEMARRIAEDIDSEIRTSGALVAMVAKSSSFGAGSRIDQYEALHNLLRQSSSFQEAMYVAPDGRELLKVNASGEPARLTRRTEPISVPFLSPPFFAGNRLPTVIIGEPIRAFANPTRQGAILAKLSFSSLNELLRQAQAGPHGVAFILNENGHLLAHPDEGLVYGHTQMRHLGAFKAWKDNPTLPTRLLEEPQPSGEPLISLAYPIPLLKGVVIVQQPRADVYAPMKHMVNQFVGWGLLCVGVFVLLAVLVGWRILSPLRKLREGAERIARGERDVRLDIRTRDELEEVGASFENMVRSIADLERMRSDLTHMIVHDLKMPLSSILPSLDAILAGEAGPATPEQKNFLQTARRSGQEMLLLIQNLLDVSRLEEGKLKLQKELFLPRDWAESIVHTFQMLAEGSKKKLTLSTSVDLGAVEGDIALLGRVLGNLISNALRHVAPATGEVSVALFRDGTQLAVEVRDNGEGIPEEDQGRIFDKFVQVEGRRVAPRTGAGLGLAFCKMVVEAHGGRIGVFSEPGEGSQFRFYLPFPATASAAPSAAPGVASEPH